MSDPLGVVKGFPYLYFVASPACQLRPRRHCRRTIGRLFLDLLAWCSSIYPDATGLCGLAETGEPGWREFLRLEGAEGAIGGLTIAVEEECLCR